MGLNKLSTYQTRVRKNQCVKCGKKHNSWHKKRICFLCQNKINGGKNE